MSHQARGFIAFLIEGLEPDERLVMIKVARIPKSRSGVFGERQLSLKSELRCIDVHFVLRCLQDKGMVTQVNAGKGLWKVTRHGKLVEHVLEDRRIGEELGFRHLRWMF